MKIKSESESELRAKPGKISNATAGLISVECEIRAQVKILRVVRFVVIVQAPLCTV